jgi:glycosyltransferase involved in cell wall biosynthesis
MEIAHVIESLAATHGGPQAVTMSLAAEQSLLGNKVRIVSGNQKDTLSWWSQWQSHDKRLTNVSLQVVPLGNAAYYQRRKAMRLLGTQVDMLHLHGIWRSLTWSSLTLPMPRRARTFLAPHGMLSGWSLKQKPMRKHISLRLGWQTAIEGANAIQVLNNAEREEVLARFPNTRVELLPNGVAAEALARPNDSTPIQSKHALPLAPYVLFLARLHHMKGPDRLLDAFAALIRSDAAFATYRLVFAGADAGMLPMLQARAAQLGVTDNVEFIGHISGPQKEQLLKHALLLCQPSHYEGFSVSLLEALAAGVPVITTPTANFPEISRSGSGIICDGNPSSIATALRVICSDDVLRRQMGAAGRELVSTRYTWESIAKRSLEIYKSLK